MGARPSAYLALLTACLLAGCQAPMRAEPEPVESVAFHQPAPAEPTPTLGERAATKAANLTGTRYRFGGTSPAQGFDCSGLVHFSYREAAGIVVPRDTRSLRSATQRIDRAELKPGDLIFFRLRGPHGHVGIYAGDGRFVHAPSAGKRVRLESLDSPYWQGKYAESRRLQLD